MENIVGYNIRRLRKSKRLRQEELAEKINVSDATVSSWETGRTEPSIDKIRDICAVLHCNMTDIVEDGVSRFYATTNIDTAIDELSDISGLIDETIERLKGIRKKY